MWLCRFIYKQVSGINDSLALSLSNLSPLFPSLSVTLCIVLVSLCPLRRKYYSNLFLWAVGMHQKFGCHKCHKTHIFGFRSNEKICKKIWKNGNFNRLDNRNFDMEKNQCARDISHVIHFTVGYNCTSKSVWFAQEWHVVFYTVVHLCKLYLKTHLSLYFHENWVIHSVIEPVSSRISWIYLSSVLCYVILSSLEGRIIV